MTTKTTLVKVLMKACDDDVFFKQLLKDPVAALEQAGLRLSPDDLKKLKQIIKTKKICLNLVWVVTCCREAKHKVVQTEQPSALMATMPRDVDLGPWKF